MTPPLLRLTAPSRLHFGLLAWGEEAPRQFGSVGLMVDRPGLTITARSSPEWAASGPLAGRVEVIMHRVLGQFVAERIKMSPLHLAVESAPDEHVGLGTGTQLSLSVASILLHASGEIDPSIARLVDLTGRGLRSGIGLHGFARGGLLVDGGRAALSAYPPLLARIAFPTEWSVLIIVPPLAAGLSDSREREAFARLPDLPIRTIDRLCRLSLLGVLPAVAEADLERFGASLGELQSIVGRCFAPAQGGIFGHPELEAIGDAMSRQGLVGIGQSSWGPALYGFISADDNRKRFIARELISRFPILTNSLIWTKASVAGAAFRSD